LLLLDGIPKFYHRYGYCDVYDLSTLELDRQALLALPHRVSRTICTTWLRTCRRCR
jgi:hypothetical protein